MSAVIFYQQLVIFDKQLTAIIQMFGGIKIYALQCMQLIIRVFHSLLESPSSTYFLYYVFDVKFTLTRTKSAHSERRVCIIPTVCKREQNKISGRFLVLSIQLRHGFSDV